LKCTLNQFGVSGCAGAGQKNIFWDSSPERLSVLSFTDDNIVSLRKSLYIKDLRKIEKHQKKKTEH